MRWEESGLAKRALAAALLLYTAARRGGLVGARYVAQAQVRAVEPWRPLGDQLQCMRRFQAYLNPSRPISRVLAAPLAWNTSFSMSIPAA